MSWFLPPFSSPAGCRAKIVGLFPSLSRHVKSDDLATRRANPAKRAAGGMLRPRSRKPAPADLRLRGHAPGQEMPSADGLVVTGSVGWRAGWPVAGGRG